MDRKSNPSEPSESGVRRAPRTYQHQSYHLALDQRALQMNWSLYRRRRQRETRLAVPPPRARLVRWTNRVRLICGRCRRTLGYCVAFQVDDGFGIVEDIAQPVLVEGDPPSLSTDTTGKPYWIKIIGDGRDALVILTCGRCRRTYPPRKAQSLGSAIVKDQLREKIID